ncbi:hypothetical protein KY331_05585 [Candidatus Woesearchaeota archaeon]|nr:hypothetical protein [Candidatus Woesearchaeota archaeon]
MPTQKEIKIALEILSPELKKRINGVLKQFQGLKIPGKKGKVDIDYLLSDDYPQKKLEEKFSDSEFGFGPELKKALNPLILKKILWLKKHNEIDIKLRIGPFTFSSARIKMLDPPIVKEIGGAWVETSGDVDDLSEEIDGLDKVIPMKIYPANILARIPGRILVEKEDLNKALREKKVRIAIIRGHNLAEHYVLEKVLEKKSTSPTLLQRNIIINSFSWILKVLPSGWCDIEVNIEGTVNGKEFTLSILNNCPPKFLFDDHNQLIRTLSMTRPDVTGSLKADIENENTREETVKRILYITEAVFSSKFEKFFQEVKSKLGKR